jgi:hypothetical protein
MILIAQLAAAEGSSALARLAEPWNALYSDSKVVSSAVVFLHLVPLLWLAAQRCRPTARPFAQRATAPRSARASSASWPGRMGWCWVGSHSRS